MKKDKLHTVIPETYDSMPMKKVKIYPTFRLGDDDLPDLKTMEVGKKYTLEMEVMVKSKAQGNEWGGDVETDKTIRATFKVLKVGVDTGDDTKTPKKPQTRAEFEIEQAAKTRGGDGTRYGGSK